MLQKIRVIKKLSSQFNILKNENYYKKDFIFSTASYIILVEDMKFIIFCDQSCTLVLIPILRFESWMLSKMKVSIILGVIHMTFGVCLSYWNATYFKRPLNIFAEFIPQIIFLTCMFGYLTLLMWMKWTMYSAGSLITAETER